MESEFGYTLITWKKAVNVLKKAPRMNHVELSMMIQCSEYTARNIIKDFKQLKKDNKLKAA